MCIRDRSRQSALVLVANRSNDALGSRGDVGRGQDAVSEELGRLEGVGEVGRGAMTRLEQRGAAAFTVVIFIALVIAGLF